MCEILYLLRYWFSGFGVGDVNCRFDVYLSEFYLATGDAMCRVSTAKRLLMYRVSTILINYFYLNHHFLHHIVTIHMNVWPVSIRREKQEKQCRIANVKLPIRSVMSDVGFIVVGLYNCRPGHRSKAHFFLAFYHIL